MYNTCFSEHQIRSLKVGLKSDDSPDVFASLAKWNAIYFWEKMNPRRGFIGGASGRLRSERKAGERNEGSNEGLKAIVWSDDGTWPKARICRGSSYNGRQDRDLNRQCIVPSNRYGFCVATREQLSPRLSVRVCCGCCTATSKPFTPKRPAAVTLFVHLPQSL